MQTNIGSIDRLIRLLLASVLFYLGLFLYSDSALGMGLVIGGGILTVTAVIGFCGLYRLMGIRTIKPNEHV